VPRDLLTPRLAQRPPAILFGARVRAFAAGVTIASSLGACRGHTSAPGATTGTTVDSAPVLGAPSAAPAPIDAVDAAAPTSPLPSATPATLARTLEVRSARESLRAASITLPAGWRAVRLTPGMSDETAARMAIAPDGGALVILFAVEPGAWHVANIEREAERWLGVSGGVRALGRWEPAGASAVVASATLGRDGADLTAIWRRFPSPDAGKHAFVTAGAVQRGVSAARRAEYEACLASFAETSAR
jgi:hypothetical protein